MTEKNSELATLYENSFKEIRDGQVIKGTIVSIGEKEILVDIGYKSEGVIPKSEFLSKDVLPWNPPY